jgi:hypothetical protein
MTEGFTFIPLGVGDAFTARYYTSCIALQAGGRRLLIDCPHPIRKILREGGASAGVDLDLSNIEPLRQGKTYRV